MRFRPALTATLALTLTVMTAVTSHAQGNPADPGGSFPESGVFFWVVSADILANYEGYSAVLVRGMGDGTIPTVSKVGNTYVLENGFFYASADLSPAPNFGGPPGMSPADDFTRLTVVPGNIDGFKAGDAYRGFNIFDWESPKQSIKSDDTSWPSETITYGMVTGETPPDCGIFGENSATSYPYYMFLYEGTGNVDSLSDGDLIGVWLEEYYDSKNILQENVSLGSAGMKDVLVVRFSGLPVVPEPTSAALLALGAACLGLRR